MLTASLVILKRCQDLSEWSALPVEYCRWREVAHWRDTLRVSAVLQDCLFVKEKNGNVRIECGHVR